MFLNLGHIRITWGILKNIDARTLPTHGSGGVSGQRNLDFHWAKHLFKAHLENLMNWWIHQMFIEHLLCARHCAVNGNAEMKKTEFCLWRTSIQCPGDVSTVLKPRGRGRMALYPQYYGSIEIEPLIHLEGQRGSSGWGREEVMRGQPTSIVAKIPTV